MSDLNKFRDDTKEWLNKNCPPSMRSGADPSTPPMKFGEAEMPSIKTPNLSYG